MPATPRQGPGASASPGKKASGAPAKPAAQKAEPSPRLSAESKAKLSTQATFQFTHSFTHENSGRIDDDYTTSKDMLGEGSYGQVCIGTHKLTGAKRAIKMIGIEKISDKERFAEEVAVQQSLDHPHIVKLYEVFKDLKKVYMVLELCTGGELFDRIVEVSEKAGDGKAFDERDAARVLSQIMGAVHYLHKQKYVHRDIKPENFLLQNKDDDAPIKVIDFGLAKKFTPGKSELHTKAGTPYYVAPDVLHSTRRQGYDEKCDIWSCGVITYILLCGYPPFFGNSDDEILSMVKKGKYDFPESDWKAVTKEAKGFISAMLVLDPKKRASAEDLINHPWLVQANADRSGRLLAPDFHTHLKSFRCTGKLKRVCLTIIAKHMKEEDISDLQQTFLALDRNHDGTLTAKEIKDGLLKHGNSIPEGLDEIIKKLDTDGSGAIDYTEFIAATMTHRHYTKESVLWSAFRVFDRDNSGTITTEELQLVMKDLNDAQVTELMKEADLDKNGSISFDEFSQMMRKGMPASPKKGS
jgi:calcium-dependent protein kinase